ncbi:MOCO sulfurase C-terminal domain-containing protein [Hirsutella rhossiliensis]|uniref:MOSC domain-containing protein n=1 Tax=Hirsutella rhossiliensis TaxID=111463 RepID=A0A9P8SNX4_9HYPO|nr:MOSC domain-containing protein [Hirsutella rhossiliensis]KAH0967581.1 MOSC domain-containing protein [Hirsutella rhossiliensis]
MKNMPGLKIQSGIDKKLCSGPIKLGKLGLEGDEHDLTFHGGPDKAVLGYCSSHYPGWRHSYPERAEKFVPGGFGENFVTAHMNERNVCIGDVISVGSQVLLQVSLPRQPCFKLNHRFSLKNFAPITHQTSRTGWYYRVLRPGEVSPGDEIRLTERKWPEWTVERVQEYLHRDKENLDMNRKLAELDALGEESLKQDVWKDWRIISRRMQTSRVVSIVLEHTTPEEDAQKKLPGAHARIKLPNGLIRSYSVVAGGDSIFNLSNKMELGVALEDNSRGGSRYLHESAKVGDILQVGRITTDVDAASSASHHCFIAGGIGLTAFLAMIKGMHSINFSYILHYAVRSAEDIPFRDRLESFKENIVFYDKSEGQRMNIEQIVQTLTWNSQLYVCGPNRMMEAARSAVEACGIPPTEVHYEAFAADISGDPFEAIVANRAEQTVTVGEEESLLEALRRKNLDVPSSCEVGNCGTCKVTLKEGRVQHRGTALTPEEKYTSMLACVSRGIGRVTIEV